MITVEEVKRTIHLWTTPQELRELATDLEKEWNSKTQTEMWGDKVPHRVIDGKEYTIEISLDQTKMPPPIKGFNFASSNRL